MRTEKIGEVTYEQWLEDDGNILCTCVFGSLHLKNYIEGKTVCHHIKKVLNEKHDDNKVK